MKNTIQPSAALALMQAGKAIITLESQKTGVHFTYKIRESQNKPGWYFCSVLTGPDNGRDYTYFGSMVDQRFIKTRGSKISEEAKSVKAFVYTLDNLALGRTPSVNIYHEGRCCRCGRTLTTPESVSLGIGPECRTRMSADF